MDARKGRAPKPITGHSNACRDHVGDAGWQPFRCCDVWCARRDDPDHGNLVDMASILEADLLGPPGSTTPPARTITQAILAASAALAAQDAACASKLIEAEAVRDVHSVLIEIMPTINHRGNCLIKMSHVATSVRQWMERSMGPGRPSVHPNAARAMRMIKFYASGIVHDNDEATRPARFEVMCRYIVRLLEVLRQHLPGDASFVVQALQHEVAGLKIVLERAQADAKAREDALQKDLQLADLLSRAKTPIPQWGVTTPLHEAARAGNLGFVRELVVKGVESLESTAVAGDPWNNRTPLLLAAKAGHDGIVLYLTNAGADVNAKDEYGQTALMLVASKGNEAVTRALLDAGADANAKKNSNNTALMMAARQGHEAVTRALLTAGAEVNAKNDGGTTALLLAASNGHGVVTAALLAAGADVNATNDGGTTALMMAASYGHEAVTCALLAAGADVNAKDQTGHTALMMAAYKGHEVAINALLAAGADVNAQDQKGHTALMGAVHVDNEAVTHELLAAGADVNATGDNGWTALMRAAIYDQEAVTQVLIDAGADVNAMTNESWPLGAVYCLPSLFK